MAAAVRRLAVAGASDGPGRVKVGDLFAEVGDLVGLDGYPGIDRGGASS